MNRTFEERRAAADKEYAYRRGYDQAWAFALYILKKYGNDLGTKRLRNLKPHIYRWRASVRMDTTKYEYPPGCPAYDFDRPKRKKDVQFHRVDL